MATTYQWTRFYPALARRLLDYERRQPDLLSFLNDLASRDLLPRDAVSALGSQVDPFSLFASFNRGVNTRIEKRREILTLLKKQLDVAEAVPDHFDAIPVVDAQQSWFLPRSAERQPGDVDSLWQLARSAVQAGGSSLNLALFDRCLLIKTVGLAKLTMGLFWLRPTDFLPLDGKTRAYLERKGIAVPRSIDGAAYKALISEVRAKVSADFVQISSTAWSGQERPRRYFAGGIKWDDISKRDEFVRGSFWQLGYKRGTSDPVGIRCWKRFDDIQPGDWFAVKGLGGRYDLKVHLIGEVKSIDRDAGRIELAPRPVPLFAGKAPAPGPGGGGWFDALLKISQPETIQKIFGTRTTPLTPPPEEDISVTRSSQPLNLILFGPPGTGKTHELQRILRDEFGPSETHEVDDQALQEQADALTWFEVVALALHNLGGTATVAALCKHPLIKAKNAVNPRRHLANGLWATLQEHTIDNSQTVHYARRTEPYIFDKEGDSVWKLAGDLDAELTSLADEIFSRDETTQPEPRHTFVTFHQSFSYEDFIEGIRPQVVGEDSAEGESLVYRVEPGVLHRAAERALHLTGFEGSLHEFCTLLSPEDRAAYTREAPQYVIAIDEINRGNVSRILGELISVVEPSKRLGAEHELIVTLPYSRQRFGLPANLYFLGTMNTADRSIESLDTALRRRFHFREMRPDYDLLSGLEIEGVDVAKLLARINDRLTVLLDRDHQLGHSYFLSLKQEQEAGRALKLQHLQSVFCDEVLPLLQEYFYSDYSKIGLVLGPDFVRPISVPRFPPGIADDLLHDLRDLRKFELTDVVTLEPAAFRKIYEP